MNILYYSCHQILEDDEVRLFKDLGHNVVVLGANGPTGAAQPFRPAIQFAEAEKELYRIYEELGGDYFGERRNIIPKGFIDLFDVSVIMHDCGIIRNYWDKFREKPVVWRTIGQGVDSFETEMKPYREAGMKIVRYSEIESEIPNSMGQDAFIRFYKDPAVYQNWRGDRKNVLTFANQYQQIYPQDAKDYRQIVNDFPAMLGGAANETFDNSIGLVTFEQQVDLYQTGGCYLYASGLNIPYTLNFIEAWMTGIPIIVFAPRERRGRFFEIANLLGDGQFGIVAETVASARKAIRLMLEEPDAARRLGQSGREAAVKLFGKQTIATDWANFLSTLR